MRDVRYALRVLLSNPGFLVTSVLTLAVGIGANSAIFSAINTILLQPLPFPDAHRLVFVREQVTRRQGGMTVPDFLDWHRDQRVFEPMAAWGAIFVSVADGGSVERWPARRVSADYFRVLGTPPALGRDFTADDEPFGAPKSVIISDGLWRGRFNADRSMIGRVLNLNGESYTVIGVSAPEAEALDDPNLFYLPLALTPAEIKATGSHWMTAIARLKPELTIAQAEARLAPLAEAAKQARPWSNIQTTIALQPMQEAVVGGVRQPLWLLFAVVVAVLLIACANVANLVLIRSVARAHEIAIRTALGASRWQIVRQLVIENVTLAVIGGTAGLLVANWARALLPLLLPDSVLKFAHPAIDWRVLAFTATLAIAIGLVAGLVPALQISRRRPQDTLRDAARGSAGPQRHRLGAALVIAELALALMLLVGAGLLVRSFVRLLSVDPGIKSEGLVLMTISLPEMRYGENERIVPFFDQVIEGARHVPGVKSVGAASKVPFRDPGNGLVAFVEGRPRPSFDRMPFYFFRSVSPGYFATMGIPLVKGRMFTSDDRAGRPRVGLLNQTAARLHFPNEDPIGLRLKPDDGDPSPVEIIGIVADVKHFGLGEDARSEMFVPYAQTSPFIWRDGERTLSLIVRTATSNPAAIVPSIREMVRKLDSGVPTYRVATMTQAIDESKATPQRYMIVVSAFGAIALALAAIGVYGVMMFLVRQRTHEIGVRMALGAARADVLRLVFGRVVRLTVIGLGIGLALALILTRWLSAFLYEIRPTDALTYLLGGVVLFAVALFAAYVPAYRATRIDPVTALRVE